MGKKEGVKLNIVFNVFFRAMELMIPFITTPYVSRVLKADNLGINSFSSGIVAYFILVAQLGTQTYGQRKIAYYRDNKEEYSRMFWQIFCFRGIMSALMLIAYFIYIQVFKNNFIIQLIYAVQIINVFTDASWFFYGMEQFRNIVLRNFIIRVVCLIGIFVFVKDINDLWKYVLIIVGSQFLGNLSIWVLIPKYIVFVKRINPFSEIKDMFFLFIPTVAINIYTILDKSMIGWITKSNNENGCYEQAERCVRLAISVVTAVSTVIFSRVANLFQNNKMEEARKYLYKGFQLIWALCIPIMMGLISISSIFIPLFLGEGFERSIILMMVLSGLVPAVSVSNLIGMGYLIPTKQQNVYTISVSIAAFINMAINFILISKLGALGAAISSVIAETVAGIIQIVYCLIKKQLVAKEIFLPSLKYFFSGIVMLLVIYGIKQFTGKGIWDLIIVVFSGVFIYVLVLFLLRDSLLISTIKSIKDRITKKIYK